MKIADKNTKAVDLVREALAKAKQFEGYHCFISMNEARALEKAREIDEKIAKGEKVGRLAGVPYALKDNYLSPEGVTTAAAKMLDNFPAPITATAVKRIEDEGAIMIGRTNLDAYAHGSSTENSYFGPTCNAADKERVAGGSSGGSAVATALGIVEFALGSDTGGSIRQPASFNGVYGIKPTYGTVSRYGVVAMASSTDTMGCCAKNAEDINLVMDIMAGKDEKDSTTLEKFWKDDLPDPKGKKIGIITDFMGDGVDKEVVECVLQIFKCVFCGAFRNFVCKGKLLASNSVEGITKFSSCKSSLSLLVSTFPFLQAPVICKTTAAYCLAEIGTLLVVRH